jgi:hypothetical protein
MRWSGKHLKFRRGIGTAILTIAFSFAVTAQAHSDNETSTLEGSVPETVKTIGELLMKTAGSDADAETTVEAYVRENHLSPKEAAPLRNWARQQPKPELAQIPAPQTSATPAGNPSPQAVGTTPSPRGQLASGTQPPAPQKGGNPSSTKNDDPSNEAFRAQIREQLALLVAKAQQDTKDKQNSASGTAQSASTQGGSGTGASSMTAQSSGSPNGPSSPSPSGDGGRSPASLNNPILTAEEKDTSTVKTGASALLGLMPATAPTNPAAQVDRVGNLEEMLYKGGKISEPSVVFKPEPSNRRAGPNI